MLNQRLITAAMLMLAIVARAKAETSAHSHTSSALGLPVELSSLSPEDLQAIQLRLESEAATRTGHLVACTATPLECISAYRTLTSMNWARSSLRPGDRIIVGSGLTRRDRIHPQQVSIHFSATQTQLANTWQATPRTASEQTLTIEQVLAQIQETTEGGRCTEPTASARAAVIFGSVCEGSDAFYDHLFERPEVEFTLVRGYSDDPENATTLGPLVEPFREENILQAHVEDLTGHYGFHLETNTLTEKVLTRRFWYKGNNKLVRVRLISSTVPCPGEQRGTPIRRGGRICEAQREASRAALNRFTTALEDHQVVVYAGHSRYGHGPDFGPYLSTFARFPIRDSHALERIPFLNSQSMLVLDSCSSTQHFSQAIEDRRRTLRTRNKRLASITYDNIQYDDNTPLNINSLFIGLMQAQCPSELAAMLELSRIVPNTDASRASVQGM